MLVDVSITSAFSKNGSGGNKAGVVVQDNYFLNEKQKINLAKKLGFSETAFISSSECADYKIEYFTPEGEVPLCGHATIASFVTLDALGITGGSRYFIETKAGNLEIEMAEDGMVFMEQNRPVFDQTLDASLFEACFPNNALSLDSRLPIQIVSTGLRDILVPFDTPEHLAKAVPDFETIAEISKKQNVIGVHAFSLVNAPGLTAVCRNFAPLYGIDEESATGTSNCALACFLYQHGIRQEQYVFEQGHNLGSISQIAARLDQDREGDTIVKAAVGGYGYLIDKKQCVVQPEANI